MSSVHEENVKNLNFGDGCRKPAPFVLLNRTVGPIFALVFGKSVILQKGVKTVASFLSPGCEARLLSAVSPSSVTGGDPGC